MVGTFAEGMDETLATEADLEKTGLVLRGEIKERCGARLGRYGETLRRPRQHCGARSRRSGQRWRKWGIA